MIYKSKNPQLITAFQYNGKITDELQRIGVQKNFYSNDGSALLNGNLILLGTYIMIEGKSVVNLMSKENFELLYEPLCKEE